MRENMPLFFQLARLTKLFWLDVSSNQLQTFAPNTLPTHVATLLLHSKAQR